MIFRYLYVVRTYGDDLVTCKNIFITTAPHIAEEENKRFDKSEVWTFRYDSILKLYWPVPKQPYIPTQKAYGAHKYHIHRKFGDSKHLNKLYLQYDILYDDWFITLYTLYSNKYSFGENITYRLVDMNKWVTL